MTGELILVVDDEPDLTALVTLNLELEGYRTTTAHHGVEALAAVARQRPDLVLLDIMMPELDGWGVLARLQDDPDTRELPVVMLTALSSERDVIRGHLSGAVRYLTKPFALEDLNAAVTAGLQPRAAQPGARSEQAREHLRRLAELEAGRQGTQGVRFAGLEPRPRPAPASTRVPDRVAGLSRRQREVAGLLAAGWDARRIATRLGTSRSNIYATRKRIAQHLGVPTGEVAEEARRLGMGAEEAGGPRSEPPAPTAG